MFIKFNKIYCTRICIHLISKDYAGKAWVDYNILRNHFNMVQLVKMCGIFMACHILLLNETVTKKSWFISLL